MCIKILIHFFNAPSISGSLISSNGTSTIPIFLAATAGKTLSRSGVIVKMTDTISSVFILFSEIIVSSISFVASIISSLSLFSTVVAPLIALTILPFSFDYTTLCPIPIATSLRFNKPIAKNTHTPICEPCLAIPILPPRLSPTHLSTIC